LATGERIRAQTVAGDDRLTVTVSSMRVS